MLPLHFYEFLDNFTSIHTRDAYAKDLKDFIKFVGTDQESDWKLSDFISYRDLLSKTHSTNTVRRKLTSLQSFVKWSWSGGRCIADPSYGLRLPKAQVVKPTMAFTDEEVVKVLSAPDLTHARGRMHQLILQFLFKLGLRRSELTRIMREHIRTERGHTVLTIFGKGNKVREVPLSKELAEDVQKFVQAAPRFSGSEWLFTIDGTPLNTSTVFRIVRRYARQVGITRRVGAHACRATVISHLLDTKNVPIRDVADFAGHASVNTTSLYDKKRKGIANSAAYKVGYGT